MKIFDFHTHPGYNFHNDKLGYEITPEIFVDGLKKCGVTLCAGSTATLETTRQPREEYEHIVPELNAWNYNIHKQYPDFFIPGIHVHPDFPEMSCNEVEKYGKLGVRLIGELVPYLMEWSCRYESPMMHDILDVAAKYNMIVSGHPSNLKDMEAFAKNNPNTTIVYAHLDGYGLFDGEIELMKKYDNVYFDISAHADDRPGMIRQAVDLVGVERILFGSDYPGYQEQRFIDCVLNNRLTEAEQEAIFWGNAARLLGVE